MHLATLSKATNKVAWTVRGLGRPVKVEVLHDARGNQCPEYVKRITGPVYLEPLYGYPITADGALIEEAMDPHFPTRTPTWRNGLPSLRWFERTIRQPELIDHRASVVSLRHFWEWNYYHFHLDVLGKLKLLREQGIPRELPLALGRYARELPFVAALIQMGRLSQRDWIIPDIENRRIVLADELIYCRIDGLSYRNRVSHFLDEMELPPVPPGSSDKIFLNRGPAASRRIINFAEIRPVIEKLGFRIVDTAKLSIAEQIAIFSGTRYMAAIHGAGVTNIIYRRGFPLSLLELHASTFVNDDMKNICTEFGYAYDRLACDPVRGEKAPQASIYVEPSKLRRALDIMLQT